MSTISLSHISRTVARFNILLLFFRSFSGSSENTVRVLSSMKRRRTALEEAEKDDFSEAAKEKPSQSPNAKVVNCTANFEKAVSLATTSLQAGKLIALPTDTIYGIAGLAQSSSAVSRIYEVKERDLSKPVAICVAEISEVHKWAHVKVSEELLAELLPGPVTLVFERRFELNPELNPGTNLIGIRIPNDPFIRRLTAERGEPLALTSANKSGGKSPLSVDEFVELWPLLDLIVDGGRLGQSDGISAERSRFGSTVVDLSKDGVFKLIRDGSAMKATVDILQKHGLLERKG